jgi:hypothetical protein
LVLLSFLCFDSCVDPYNVPVPTAESYLVVDGLLTDQPGPYTIKLFRSLPLDLEEQVTHWVGGAAIIIRDDQNNVVTLRESSPGNYTTPPGFTGTVGRTYTLQITLSENERFESLPQKLLPVGQIKNIRREFVQLKDPADSLNADPKNGFNIYVDAEVLPEQNKQVRWRTATTFQIHTYPETRLIQVHIGDEYIWVPDPPLCSGYVTQGRGHAAKAIRIGDCTCCDCWPTLYDKVPPLSDPNFAGTGEIRNQQVLFLPADRRLFYKKCFVQVDQMSVTSEAYDFWKGIQKQNASGGDLFQTPGISTTGNIVPVGDTKTPVMGLFGVSSVVSTSFFIDRNEIPYTMPLIDTVDQSCLTLFYRTNTNVRPPFW